MTVEIYYKYSELDKEPQFGLVILDENYTHKHYVNCIWYYLGYFLEGKNKPAIYPFVPWGWEGVKPKIYKDCNNAERQAKLIANYINKKRYGKETK